MKNTQIFTCMVFVATFVVSTLCATQPSPTFTDVRVKFVIDSFDNDEIETKIPYSLLESVLQSVDSVYLSPLGQCNCDCAGGDLSFYLSKKENASASFYTNIGLSHICSPINQNTELVLRVKDKHKIKAIADTLMSIKGK